MKYFKSKTNFKLNGGACLDNASALTSDPLSELVHASERMHKDGISRLWAPLSKRELKLLNQYKKNALPTKY